MPKLVLLDGHSLAYRAFYALPSDLATSTGQVTNAAYGFTSMLIKLLGDESPDAAAVCWDVPGKTFRKEEFTEYKAQREAPPDIFRSQLPLIEKVVGVLQISQFGVPGYEADDVIATLARRARDRGWEVLVVTGDRDSFQLIDKGVRVVYTRRGISDTVNVDADYVRERYGIGPDQYTEYAALRGDTSDNLPGVPGVGEKTAAKLLNEYGSLAEVFSNTDKMSPKLAENMESSKEQVLLNARLMKLVEDVPLEGDLDELRLHRWDQAEVREVFDGLEFHSLWSRLQELGGAGPAPVTEAVEVEVSIETDESVLDRVRPAAVEPVWDGDELAGIACAIGEARALFVPADRLGGLRRWLQDPAEPKNLHNAKETLVALAAHGIDLRGLEFDTALAAYVINPSQRDYNLPDLAGRVLGIELEPVAADKNGAAGQGALDFEGTAVDVEAAGRRAVAVAMLVEPLASQLEARDAGGLYSEIEVPLIRVLARMEEAGIGVDRSYLEELGESLRERLAALERKIHDEAGEPFNVNSTNQLREVLFDKLELPVLKKTPKGLPSTDASVLEKLAEDHAIIEMLLEYRQLEKLRSTYIDGLLPLVGEDGRIHARFNQMAASTGRLSSERPNLQNIPIRSEEGRTIRRAFVAAEGSTFIVADYSQIELRVLAHLTGDPGLLEAFRAGLDIHTATAARIAGIEPEAVDPDLRRRAKTVNFGLLYGMEAYGLGQRLQIEREEAQELIDAYFGQFPRVKEFMDGIVGDARDQGFTTTIFGRRRYLPELAASNFRTRQMGERMALNAPIQGSAADIIKLAMIAVDGAFAEEPAQLVLQVHDELVVECPDESVEGAIITITELMEGVTELAVPLTVDVATGKHLGETKG